ncbi:MAG: DUF3604 domain-containing protein [Pseudomonadales bacterium]|nr:DUF3604 domain-containing protein [Pseudomonadales bacterium]
MIFTNSFKKTEIRLLIAITILTLLFACTNEGERHVVPDDYMTPELRARVDQLKSDLASEATNESSIVERADLLADWIDAYAMAGGEVGIDAPRVRLQATLAPTGQQAVNQSRNVDQFIREFILRDEEGSLGLLTSDTLGPFVVSSMAELRQTWRVGTKPIVTGGGFWVARHFNANWGTFQTEDPAAAGYVSISTDDDDAVFERETIMASGPHGGFRRPQPAIAFRVVEGELDRGSSVTIAYGDRSQGGSGIMTPTFESERMPLPLYVDLDGSSEWRSLPITPFEIVGGETTGVHGFAPSVVEPGESFELSVRAQDQYFNRATGDIPAFEVLLNNEIVATTNAGADAITVLDLALNEPGVYWISIRSADGSITGEGNPILVEENPEFRIYWGDTHGHSGYSEGIGTVDYFMRFARDDARLDYVTHSEHDVWLDAGEWDLIRRTSAEYDEPGKFIPYLGWEWTRHTRFGGHHNVLFRTIEDQIPVSAMEFPVLSSLYAELHERHDPNNIVVIPHAHNPGDFRQSDPQLEPIIEIMSMHGSFQWFMEAYLSHGHEVGVVAASDDHLSRPGYSAPHRNSLAQRGGLGAVLAPERSRDAIFDGMKAKRTYATTGDRIILDFDVNGTGMGQRADYSDSRVVSGRAIGTAPLKSIQLLKNDEVIWEEEYLLENSASIEQQLLISFTSDPTPYFSGDAPRGWRHWDGDLNIANATVVDAKSMDFFNPFTQAMVVDNNTISFRTNTRGDTSSILLTLTGVNENATISFDLDETIETGSAPPFYRRHATIAATQTEIALSELEEGKITRTLAGPDYPEDAITIRRVITEGTKDISFSFDDTSFPDQGDYYYFKVEQANDAIAWSSPIWIGGFPSR